MSTPKHAHWLSMPSKLTPVKGGQVAFLLLLLLTAAFFHPVLSGRRVFFYGDIDKFFYPAKLMVAKAISAWRLPVWDTTLMGGIPVLAHPLYGASYPPSLILALLPFHLGLGVYFAIHFMLAGLFTYYLMREWNVSQASSLVAALSFTFGGVMISSANVPPILQTMTWFPMLMLCFQRAIGRGSGIYLVFSALALALMFYGGEIHLAYIALVVLFLWVVVETGHNLRHRESSPLSQWPPIGFVVVLLVGILLSLPLLFPTGLFVSLSTRASELSFEKASWFSLSPGGLLGFLSPSLFFDKNSITPWYEVTGVFRTGYFLSLYIGALPLVLSFIGMATAGRKLRWLFLAILLLSLAAAIGRDLPLFLIIHRYVPFMGMFRYPEKFLVFSVFFLALFSGFGAETLLRWCSPEAGSVHTDGPGGMGRYGRSGENTYRILKWLLPWVLVVGITWVYGAKHRDQFMAFVKWLDVFSLPLSGENGDYHAALMRDLMRFAGLVAAAMVFFIVTALTGKGRFLLGPLLVGLTALGLFTAHRGINATAPKEYYLSPPEVVRYLEKEEEPYRVHSLIFEKRRGSLPMSFSDIYSLYLWEKEALKPNTGSIYGIQYADSESALRLGTQLNFINRVFRAPPGVKEKLLGIYNVKYLLAFHTQEEELSRRHSRMELVQKFGSSGILLYRNRDYLPRAYFVPSARFVDTDEQALSVLLNKGFDPSKEVIIAVSGNPGEPAEGGGRETPLTAAGESATEDRPGAGAGLRLIEYSDNLVSVSTDFNEGGYLVLSDIYYPGWAVTINDTPGRILRANYLFRAVKLPPGRHRVEFSYTPRAFFKGMSTGWTWGGMGIALVLIFYFKGRRETAEAGEEEPTGGNGSHE